MDATLIISVGKLIFGLWKDAQDAAEAEDEAALQAIKDRLEKDRADITAEIKAQIDGREETG